MDHSVEVEKHYEVRGWYSTIHEIRHDGGTSGETLVKAAVGVIIRNPLAGKFVADLSELTEPSPAIGHALGARAAALLGGRPVESYGKGGIAGTAGEQEHVVACITTVFGDPLREEVGGGMNDHVVFDFAVFQTLGQIPHSAGKSVKAER